MKLWIPPSRYAFYLFVMMYNSPCVRNSCWRCSQAYDLEYESLSENLQEVMSRVINVRRSLDDANAQAWADAEEAERLQGQLRSAAEAHDAAVQEHDVAKDECEAAVRERDEVVLCLNTTASL